MINAEIDRMLQQEETAISLANCAVCLAPLTEESLARREDGRARKDALGRFWCQICTDKHDEIDWDEIYEQKLM